MQLILICIIFISSLLSHAKTQKKAKAKNTYNSIFEVPFDEKEKFSVWKKYMNTSMQKDLCEKEGILNKCFKISDSKCRVFVRKQFNVCSLPYNKIKYIQPAGKSGYELAKNIGTCVGQRYSDKFKNYKTGRKGCD